ncbi:aromatic ring-hydroxylating oxygenase subunit alpha [Sulfolobus sp. E11-6]|uniref:aromatic ring-hydroxylating oxygenase subunit alpha n=1 Tax=Sulfolobus sp. E11-6 TaxID=2663020 RepID=UPI001296B67E|nr:Rieske 2Fe-2S domain-containing protein [Sulfolobus sp. E11-6]QGA68988.1 Rieske 2Fe-2S domain-containing protein [Sulfolobus sp. E11-6]
MSYSKKSIKDYIIADKQEAFFKLNSEVYTDPYLFNLEMEKIFYKGWIYLCHESQLKVPNDYLTTYIGEIPIILARTEEGKIVGLINRCRHRGSLVCRQQKGNSKFFRCPYHGWTYSNDGRLVGIPDSEGYPEQFNMEKLGLIKIPKLVNYYGFIFGSLSSDVPEFENYIGEAGKLLRLIAKKFPGGIEVLRGYHKYGIPINWKLAFENAVDHYHAPFVHESYFEAVGHNPGRRIDLRSKDLSLYLGKGHLVDLMFREYEIYEVDEKGSPWYLNNNNDLTEIEKKWASKITFHLAIFPNVIVFDVASPGPTIRVIRPVKVNYTEVYSYYYLPKNAPKEYKEKELRASLRFYGPAGMGTPDDLEVLKLATEGYKVKEKEGKYNDLSRGIHRDFRYHEILELVNAEMIGHGTDDTGYRGFYKWWAKIVFDEELDF